MDNHMQMAGMARSDTLPSAFLHAFNSFYTPLPCIPVVMGVSSPWTGLQRARIQAVHAHLIGMPIVTPS
jgi:hypothetical protein